VPLTKSDIITLDYVVDSASQKIFTTNSKDNILECRSIFKLNSIGDILLRRQRNSLQAYTSLDNNLICRSVVSLSTNVLSCGRYFAARTRFFSLSRSFIYTVCTAILVT
jgi:hypothetical protein